MYLKQIVDAFSALEEKKACHRDLKPANVLMFNKVLKIADFGFARMVPEDQSEYTQVGSPMYMSPDALLSPQYNPFKTDVWAAGIMFYQMLYGVQSFPWMAKSIVALSKAIQNNEMIIPPEPKRNPLILDLLRNMLNKQENLRFSWKQIAEHPLFNPAKMQKFEMGAENNGNMLMMSLHNVGILQ